MKKTILCIICGIMGIIQCLSCAAQQTTVTRPNLDDSTMITTQTVNEDSASISLEGYNNGIQWANAEDTIYDHAKADWYVTINNNTSGSIYKREKDKYYQTGVKYAAYQNKTEFHWEKSIYQK